MVLTESRGTPGRAGDRASVCFKKDYSGGQMAIKRLLPIIGTGKVAMATRRVEKVKIYLRKEPISK